MEFIFILIIIIVIIISLGYLRVFIKRLSFYIRLKKTCKKNNVLIHKNSLLWLWGLTQEHGCDFYIEAKKNIYSIKIFTTYNKKHGLIFLDSETYKWQKPVGRSSYDTKDKKLRQINFTYKAIEAFRNKQITPYLLISPAIKNIYLENRAKNFRQAIGELEFIKYFFIISQVKLLEKIKSMND